MAAWTFSGMQDVTNDSIDIYDMTGHSIVKSYSSATMSSSSFLSLQDINYTHYDRFVCRTREHKRHIQMKRRTVLKDYKEIVNDFNTGTAPITRWARKLGN